jgi:hypothetical protein
MSAVRKLLDKAIEHCSPSNASTLGRRLGLSRQVISDWGRGISAMPEDRITEIAHIAMVDPAVWLPAIRSEQSTDAQTARAWAVAAKRLGFAKQVERLRGMGRRRV